MALAVLAGIIVGVAITEVSDASAVASNPGPAPTTTADAAPIPAGDDVPAPGERPAPTTTTTVPPTTTTTAPPPPPPTTVPVAVAAAPVPATPPPPPPRTRVDRCWEAIDAVLATGFGPAPRFSFECGPAWNTSADGRTQVLCDDGSRGDTCHGMIQIHPDDSDSDAHWRLVVRHEIGHTWCAFEAVDFSEACAQRYE